MATSGRLMSAYEASNAVLAAIVMPFLLRLSVTMSIWSYVHRLAWWVPRTSPPVVTTDFPGPNRVGPAFLLFILPAGGGWMVAPVAGPGISGSLRRPACVAHPHIFA